MGTKTVSKRSTAGLGKKGEFGVNIIGLQLQGLGRGCAAQGHLCKRYPRSPFGTGRILNDHSTWTVRSKPRKLVGGEAVEVFRGW